MPTELPFPGFPTDPYNYRWYTELVLEHGGIRGDESIIDLVAVGAAESALLNLAIGENWKNGTPVDSPAYFFCGWGWLQLDEYWLRENLRVNGIEYDIEAIRRDPAYSIDYILRAPSYVWQGEAKSYVTYRYWAVHPKKSDAHYLSAKAALGDVLGTPL